MNLVYFDILFFMKRKKALFCYLPLLEKEKKARRTSPPQMASVVMRDAHFSRLSLTDFTIAALEIENKKSQKTQRQKKF